MSENSAKSAEPPELLPPPAPPPPPNPDEELRRIAGSRLVEHLDMGVTLVSRCKALASVNRGDRVEPLSAAARLMNSTARVASVLAQVALVERRHRSIIERIQPPMTELEKLNLEKEKRWSRPRAEIRAEIGTKVANAVAKLRQERMQRPCDPQEEANLRLQEEEWNAEDPKRLAMGMYRQLRKVAHEL